MAKREKRTIWRSVEVRENVDVEINIDDVIDSLSDRDLAEIAKARGLCLVPAGTISDGEIEEIVQAEIRYGRAHEALIYLEYLCPSARGIADLVKH